MEILKPLSFMLLKNVILKEFLHVGDLTRGKISLVLFKKCMCKMDQP